MAIEEDIGCLCEIGHGEETVKVRKEELFGSLRFPLHATNSDAHPRRSLRQPGHKCHALGDP